MYKVRYSCLSVQGIWGMSGESGENCTDPEEDRYLGQVLPHTGKNQPHPLPPKLHYHVIIHFEIHVYLHFPVSLYIQSLNFIDCYGTMVVLFIRDVVCVRGGCNGSPLFQNCYSHELQLLSTDLFDLYFRAGRRQMLSCVLYMGT